MKPEQGGLRRSDRFLVLGAHTGGVPAVDLWIDDISVLSRALASPVQALGGLLLPYWQSASAVVRARVTVSMSVKQALM